MDLDDLSFPVWTASLIEFLIILLRISSKVVGSTPPLGGEEITVMKDFLFFSSLLFDVR